MIQNKNININKLINILKNNDNFIIIYHDYPDADTIGSSIALCSVLRLIGKTSYIYENINTNKKFKKYLNKYIVKNNKFFFEKNSYFFITCDVSDIKLISNFTSCCYQKIDLSIDHHFSNTLYAKKNYIDHKRAACGEIIYKIINKMNININKDIVNGIYMAIAGDTGNFKFTNTNKFTHEIAAWCLNNGVDNFKINFELFESIDIKTFKCLEWIIKNTKFYHKNQISVLILNEDFLYSKFNVYIDDLQDLIYLSRKIKKLKLILVFKNYINSDNIKLSIRSNSEISALKFSKYFGGGGHDKAAGITFLKSSIDLMNLIPKMIDMIKFDIEGVFKSC